MLRRSFLSALASSPVVGYLLRGPRKPEPVKVQPVAAEPTPIANPDPGEWVVAERLKSGDFVILGPDGMVHRMTSGDQWMVCIGVAGHPYNVGDIIKPVTKAQFSGTFRI